MSLKISIITPSYNQSRFIEQTIQSVLSQNYPYFEHIVMDGGSTDNTVSILKKYDGKIKWFSEKDKGQSDAINKGLRRATGDVVTWLNSDDYYLPGTLKKIADFFEGNKSSKWVSGDYIIVDENGKAIQPFVVWYKKLLRTYPTFSMLSFANFIIQPSTFFRRELLEDVGYVNESYKYCMDYDLWMRIIRKHRLSIITSPLSVFRIHKASKGGSQYIRQFEEELTVVKKYNMNGLIFRFHKIHNQCINFIYGLIK